MWFVFFLTHSRVIFGGVTQVPVTSGAWSCSGAEEGKKKEGKSLEKEILGS